MSGKATTGGGLRALTGGLDSQSAAFVDAITAGLKGHPARMQQLLGRALRHAPTALHTNPALLEALHAAVAMTSPATLPAVVPDSAHRPVPQQMSGVRLELSAADPMLSDALVPDRDPVITPALEPAAHQVVSGVVAEYRSESLAALGINPTRTLLLTGEPGTGKTITARWIASELGWPLLRLDLAAVMDKALGRSAQNLVAALESAAQAEAVLFIDEFDAVGSARASSSDVGEIRRLVNVLLLALDAWPADHLLIAATNHPQLLDPALHRRFEVSVKLAKPGPQLREQLWQQAFPQMPVADTTLLASLSTEWSGSDIATCALRVRRAAGLNNREPALDDALDVLRQSGLTRASQSAAIDELVDRGYEPRQIASIVGVTVTTVQSAIGERERDGGTRRERPGR